MTPLLQVEGLRAGFGANTVLHGLSFEVAGGEIAAMLGLNGAGKSVAMKVIGGVVPAWSGAVRFGGRDVTALSVEGRVARGMGHVPQGRQLFGELTVEENLRLGAYLLRRHRRHDYPRLLAGAYDRFPRLAERREQLAGSLSGGEQAMLAVARALMAEPQLLLVDEPSAGLSPLMAATVADLLAEVNASGVTILLVEQNVALALELAHRALVMQRGQVVYEAPVPEIDHQALSHYLGIGRLLAPVSPNGRAKRRAPTTTKKGAAAAKTGANATKRTATKKAAAAKAATKRTATKTTKAATAKARTTATTRAPAKARARKS